MKFVSFFFAFTVSLLPALASADLPEISIERAVAIAREQLASRGLDKSVYIQSISIAGASMLGGPKIWKVLWSDEVKAPSGRTENGIEISMRGEVVHLVKRGSEPRK